MLRNKLYFLEEGRYKVVVWWGPWLLTSAFLDVGPGTAEPLSVPARTPRDPGDFGSEERPWTSLPAWLVLFQALLGENQSPEQGLWERMKKTMPTTMPSTPRPKATPHSTFSRRSEGRAFWGTQ